jgi:hypothetical protein
VLGTDGNVERFKSIEGYTSETMRQLMYLAPYSGEVIGKYELLDNAYRATGGFETGEYLIPHPSEKFQKYRRRQNMSYYCNYLKPCVDAHVNPIFRSEPSRDNLSPTYELFINDVDGNGTTLTRFMKRAGIRAKLHGVEFIVIDMDKIEEDQLVTEKDVIDNRIYPYLYLVKPSQVVDWSIDKFGRLNYISYQLLNAIVDDDGNKDIITESWTWTNTICKKSVNGKEEIFQNNIGIIPVVPLYGAINDSNSLIPQSDMYAIARTNLAIYNACSELRERNRNQAFSILTFPIGEDDDYDNSETPLAYGTSDCLMYKQGTQTPAFITPPAEPSTVIMDEINFQIKEIYRMASLQFSTGVQSNVSGLAKEWDNQGLFQTISELAQSLQETEYKIANIFSKYTSESMDTISVAYNNQFGITDPTAVLTNATQGLALNICPEYNIEMKKQVIRSTLKDVDTVVVERVIDNLESDASARNPIDTAPTVVQPSSGS